MYWLAYAQAHGGRSADALATIQNLRSHYPKSDWLDDAEAMEVEIRNDSGQQVAPEGIDDADLKIIAITSLIGSDPDRAMTMLEKILAKKNSSSEMKERALFVVGQLQSSRAQSMLEKYARDGSDPELQRYAIHSVAISGRGSMLASIYKQTSNRETKRSIIESFIITNDRASLLDIAENDPDAELRAEAVQKLGVVHATADLQRLYASEKSPDVKESILQGMFIGGDLDSLARLARSEPNENLRKTAIRNIGLIGGQRSYDLLIQIWNTDPSPTAKEAVIEGMFIRGDAKTLIAFARKETDRSLKRDIVQRIALMQSKEARDYMQELLDK